MNIIFRKSRQTRLLVNLGRTEFDFGVTEGIRTLDILLHREAL